MLFWRVWFFFFFLLDLPFFFAYVESLGNPARVQHFPMELAQNFSKSNVQPCCFCALAYSCWWYMQGTQTSAFWVVMSTFCNDVSWQLSDSFWMCNPPPIAHLIWVTADLLVFITYCSLLEGSMDPSSLHTIGQEILHQCQATSLLFISQLSVEIFEIFSTWFSCVWKIDGLSTS